MPTSEAWFKSVVEAANEGIWIIGLDARTIFANRRMADMLGTRPEDMIGLTPFDFLFEEDFEFAREVMGSNYEGQPMDFEIRFRRSDGSEIPVLAGSAPLRDGDGRITGSIATFSDITDRKAAQETLERSERDATRSAALLKQLLESASDAIWLRDADGRFQIVNSAAAAIMGRSIEDVVGADFHDIWPPELARKLEAQNAAIFADGIGISVEEEIFDAGRNAVRIYLSNKVPLYSSDGSPIGVLGVSRDITDRKRAEDELRTSKEQLAQQIAELNALYDSAPIGLAFFSRDYRYLRINRELAEINGLPVEQHIGRTIREVLGDEAPKVEPVIDRIFEQGEPIRDLEVSGVTPFDPSTVRHWLTGFYPVKSSNGTVDAVGAWIVEISERKRAEERELLLAREVDHRAKNLLAVVQSIVQLTPAGDGADLKTSVIGRIQALARAHSLLSDSRWDGVDLGQLVDEELAPFGGGRVTHSGPRLLLRPSAAQSLALVLHELATNAAKYGALSSGAGRLSVEWRRDCDDQGTFLEILWIESGGPDPGNPEMSGFGSKIIRASIDRQLRGKVSKEWRPDGLRCTIHIPAAELVTASGS